MTDGEVTASDEAISMWGVRWNQGTGRYSARSAVQWRRTAGRTKLTAPVTSISVAADAVTPTMSILHSQSQTCKRVQD